MEGSAPIWDEIVTFKYTNEDLIFLRMEVIHDDRGLSRNDLIALATLRVNRIQPGKLSTTVYVFSTSNTPDQVIILLTY